MLFCSPRNLKFRSQNQKIALRNSKIVPHYPKIASKNANIYPKTRENQKLHRETLKT